MTTPDLSTDHAFARLYDALSRAARSALRGGTALDARELVHEAYLKLSSHGPWETTGHFYVVATRAMGQVLRNRIRDSRRQRRGGGAHHITLSDDLHGRVLLSLTSFLDLQVALDVLDRQTPRIARVVACRAVGGLSVEETATLLGIGSATVKRDWATARAFLSRYFAECAGSAPPAGLSFGSPVPARDPVPVQAG